MIALRCVRGWGLLTCALALAGCSNGRGSLEDGSPQQEPGRVTIGGTVTGLTGTGLRLQNNGAADLSVAGNGTFRFPAAVDPGTAYNVTILTQPANPTQTCAVANGAGTAGAENVTGIAVTCAEGVFSVGGAVSGLTGSGLVLRNNGGDDLAIASNGSFTFATGLPNGAAFEVSILTQPSNPAQTCTIAAASGTIAAAHVRNVTVSCATNTYAVSGSVAGLEGSGLVLLNNGGDEIGVEASGSFSFPTALASDAAYSVTVRTQPRNPTQMCAVENGAGRVTNGAISDVLVRCTTVLFSVGGTVTGLSGSGLVLHNNGGDALRIGSNGNFTFPAGVQSGRGYDVTVATQPSGPLQQCTVTNPKGTVTTANVANVLVHCETIGFTISGSVAGLVGSGFAIQNNGGAAFAIGANGRFTLPDSLPQGSPYSVAVATQPTRPWQTCSITNPSGTIGTENVTNLSIDCQVSTFAVGGTVTGLQGFGLQLRINGGENLLIHGNGTFAFPTRLQSGSAYEVSVASPPFFPVQSCTVANGTGTVEGADISSIVVTCTR